VLVTLAVVAVFMICQETAYPEDELVLASAVKAAKTAVKAKKFSKVANSIIELKAYCMEAKKKMPSKTELNRGDATSLLSLIYKFGDPYNGDVVAEYAKAIGELVNEFQDDFWNYFMKHLNAAVLKGKSPVLSYHDKFLKKNLVTFSAEALGLKATPDYFKKKLAVTLTAWASTKEKLPQAGDAAIKEEWEKRAFQQEYEAAFEKIVAYYEMHAELLDQTAADGSEEAIKTSYKNGVKAGKGVVGVMDPLPVAGNAASAMIRKNKALHPKYKEISGKAKSKANAKVRKIKKAHYSTKYLVSKVERILTGVTIKMTTGKDTRDISGQKPGIKIIGSSGAIKGVIKALPLRDHAGMQTFVGHIGSFKEIRIFAEKGKAGDDGWLDAMFEVQMGYGGKWTKLEAVTCGGKTYENVWLDNNRNGTKGGGADVQGFNYKTGKATKKGAPSAKKWVFVPKGSKVEACTEFVAEPVHKFCLDDCGHKKHTIYGKVRCQDVYTGKKRPDSACYYWDHKKPAPKKKMCKAQPPCVIWAVKMPGSCSKAACTAANTLKGNAFCQFVHTGKATGDAKCHAQGLLKPPAPQKKCAAVPCKWKVCAGKEGSTCTCNGKVLYGRRFVTGAPGHGKIANIAQMKASAHVIKTVKTSISCSNGAFGDPMPGLYKYCMCDGSYPPVYVSATTGTIRYASSGDKATVVIKGTEGSTTGTLKANGRSGGTVISKIPAPGAIGKIVSVKLVANSQDGWEFTNIKVKVGTGKYVEMGPTNQWLDAKPYNAASAYSYLPHSDKITLLPK
jgi:hypothetical protein